MLDFAVLNFEGQINGTSGSVGGVIGVLDHFDMEMAYAGAELTSTISSTTIAGGFVGTHQNGLIRNSFAKGDVSCNGASCHAGGFAGIIDENPGTPRVSGSYAQSATVSSSGGTDKAGCFAGAFFDNPIIYNSYANCDLVAGSTFSYWGTGTFSLIDGGTQAKNVYASNSDEAFGDAEVIGFEDLYNSSAVAGTELVLYDPWIQLPGDVPRLFWETNPEILNEQE
jgi:hypothetical protein